MPFGNLNLRTLKTHLGLMVLCEEEDFFFVFFYTFVRILNANNFIANMDGKSLDIVMSR